MSGGPSCCAASPADASPRLARLGVRDSRAAPAPHSPASAESLPPEDADVIVDNAATGSTLKANSLEVFATLQHSTTRLYASAAAWAIPEKKARILKVRRRHAPHARRSRVSAARGALPGPRPPTATAPSLRSQSSLPPLHARALQLSLLLKSVLDARKRLMVTFNTPNQGEQVEARAGAGGLDQPGWWAGGQTEADALQGAHQMARGHLIVATLCGGDAATATLRRPRPRPPPPLPRPADVLERMLKFLPAMNAPTVSTLYGGSGFAVQIAAEASVVPTLVPQIKEFGGTDIVISSIRMLIA